MEAAVNWLLLIQSRVTVAADKPFTPDVLSRGDGFQLLGQTRYETVSSASAEAFTSR